MTKKKKPLKKSQSTTRNKSTAEGPKFAPQTKFLVLLVSCIVVAVAMLVSQHSSNPSSVDDEGTNGVHLTGPPYQIIGNIPVRIWEKNKPFKRVISDKLQPVILKETSVTTWPLLTTNRWTPEYLLKNVKDPLKRIHKSKNPVFGPIWREARPMISIEAVKWSNPHEDVSMTISEYFDVIQTPDTQGHSADNKMYYYYNEEVDNFSRELMSDVGDLSELLLTADSSVTIWLGQSGVSAHTHVDSYHNFYVQIYGNKKFTIFPPDQWSFLYPYPFLHPSNAQSQIVLNFTSTTIEYGDFPLRAKLKGLEGILEPGDVLYLPPFWAHQVESLNTAVALNGWSYTSDSAILEKVMEMIKEAIKFQDQETWTPQIKRKVASYIIYGTFRDLKRDAVSFVDHLTKTRYAKLINDGILPSSNELGEKLCRFDGRYIPDVHSPLFDPLNRDIAEELSKIDEFSRDIWISQFVETMAYWATGVELAGAFLMDCVKDDPPTT